MNQTCDSNGIIFLAVLVDSLRARRLAQLKRRTIRPIETAGPDADREQEAARKAVDLLGGKVRTVSALTLPAQPEEGVEPMERRLLHIDKVRHTPPAYPRPSAKIAKRPL